MADLPLPGGVVALLVRRPPSMHLRTVLSAVVVMTAVADKPRGQMVKVLLPAATWTYEHCRYELALTDTEIGHYVVSQPEIARARDVMVKVYQRLTDYGTPVAVVKEIEEQVNALAVWLDSNRPHLESKGSR